MFHNVGSATQQGKFPWYGEKCASTMSSTYSSGSFVDQKIVSIKQSVKNNNLNQASRTCSTDEGQMKGIQKSHVPSALNQRSHRPINQPGCSNDL